MEESILVEDGFAERLRDEEFDLLDDYAASRLSAEDAAAVERYLRDSTEKMHSLRVARALRRRGAADGEVSGRWPFVGGRRRRAWQVGGSVLAACLVGVAFIPHWRGMAPQAPDSAPGTGGTPSVASDAGSRAVVPADARLPIITLVADVRRGAARSSLDIEAGASAVRLQAEVPEQAPNVLYTLRVSDGEGQPLFEGSMLNVHTAGPYRFVEAVVPAVVLGPGERTVSLAASDAAAAAPAIFAWHIGHERGSGAPK